MLIYQTPRYVQKYAAYALEPRYWERRLQALESTQAFERFRVLFSPLSPYLVHRQRTEHHGPMRHLARIIRVDGQDLCCLLDVLTRDDRAYREFCKEPERVGQELLEPLVDEQTIKKWLVKQGGSRSALSIVDNRIDPPQEAHIWMQPAGWARADDCTIYESTFWVENARHPDFRIFWAAFAKLVERAILNEGTPRCPLGDPWGWVQLYSNEANHTVAFGRLRISADHADGVDAIFLLGQWLKKPGEQELHAVLSRFPALRNVSVGPSGPCLTLDDVARVSRRSYPYYLVNEFNAEFSKIELEQEANLALSAEETQLLHSLSQPNGQKVLPLFINGRAGSGKSTMLYYVFADYCWRNYNHGGSEQIGSPLFLSYNDKLVGLARQSVTNILMQHERFQSSAGMEQALGWEKDIARCFQAFQPFLFDLLPAHERDRFRSDKYVSFLKFRQILNSRGMADLTPEDCWHVIRTFIKGYWLDEFMEADDYMEVPRRERSVSVDRFARIYRHVWESWYREYTSGRGYWDDQDLVRRVLQLGCYRPDFSAIVCDEAQDFTRIELQFLLRLSIFSQYRFRPNANLPLVFAGDPFQTLNPTGFRWSRMKRIFHEELTSGLESNQGLGINFQELRYNYRSKMPIVRVTNLIQFWRRALFDIEELLPQTGWDEAQTHQPQRFILGTNLDLGQFRKQISETVILIPCEEGGERAFIGEDPQLRVMLDSGSGAPPRNVFSAVAAKGLEFNRVVLYKFGEHCPESVWTRRSRSGEQEPDIEGQHFFNKFYVAASRAKSWLFVVDTAEGEKRLWKRIDQLPTQEMVEQLGQTAIWGGHFAAIPLGKAVDINQLKEDRPEDNAAELESKGKQQRNPEHLLRARDYYLSSARPLEAAQCYAWALRFQGKFDEGGEVFERNLFLEDAKDTYREGVCWARLHAFFLRHPGGTGDRVDAEMATFMCAAANDAQAYRKFSEVLKSCISELSSTAQWSNVASVYRQRLEQIRAEAIPTAEWLEYARLFEALRAAQFPDMLEAKGDCLFRGRNYREAVYAWEKSGAAERKGRELWLAKAETSDYPDKVHWLEKLQEHQQILEEWRGHGQPLEGAWTSAVRTSLEKLEKHDELIDFLLRVREAGEAYRLFRKVPSSAEDGAYDVAKTTEVLKALLREKLWPAAIQMTRDVVVEGKLEAAARQSLGALFLRAAIAAETAHSESFRDAWREMSEITEFLAEQDRNFVTFRIEELGAACELFARDIFALSFYERFTKDSRDPSAQFARDRWIVCKQRHINRLRSDPQRRALEEARLEEACLRWGKDRNAPRGDKPDLSHLTRIGLKHLPRDAVRHDLHGGDVRLELRNRFEIRTNRERRFLLILDNEAGSTIKIDLNGRSCSGAQFSHMPHQKSMTFQAEEMGVNGSVRWLTSQVVVRIELQGLAEALELELPA